MLIKQLTKPLISLYVNKVNYIAAFILENKKIFLYKRTKFTKSM